MIAGILVPNKDHSIANTYDLNGLRTSKTVTVRTYEPAHSHNYAATVVAPNCIKDGYTLHECACGDSYKDNFVEKLGHDYVSYRDKLTGKVGRKCTRCGHILDEGGTPLLPDPNPPVVTMGIAGDATANSLGSADTADTRGDLLSTVTETHSYIYASGKLLRETITTGSTTKTLDFFYDNAGMPYALKYNGTTYYYITNLQGDVMALVNSSGEYVANYSYDPYGKVLSATGAMADINPLRYRGYYYDSETGFYYLQSRYYDPAIGRFINADEYASTGQGFIGYNMFAYCGNEPTNSSDQTGHSAKRITVAIKMLIQSLVGNGVKQLYGSNSSVSKALKKSTAINEAFQANIEDMRQTNQTSAVYPGNISTYDVSNKYDYDLSLSVGKASYTMEIAEETRTRGLLKKKTETRYVATVTVFDTYDFDELRGNSSLGDILNDIGFILQCADVIAPYEWEATFVICTEWRKV